MTTYRVFASTTGALISKIDALGAWDVSVIVRVTDVVYLVTVA